MATAQTYDGILAVATVVDSHSSRPDFPNTASVDIIRIRGYSAPVTTATIAIPLPSGCVAFDVGGPAFAFADDGSLLVTVRASSDADFSTAATHVNNMKLQLHKYKVTDDGDYELIWHSNESSFFSTPGDVSGGAIVTSRDSSWGVIDVNPFDLGTGNVTWAPLANFNDTSLGLTYLTFQSNYDYLAAGSSIANCLTRRLAGSTSSGLYEAVTFDGSVVRSANWDPAVMGIVNVRADLQFNDVLVFRGYQEPYLNVVAVYGSLTTGAGYVKFAILDPDTYLPGTFGFPQYLADSTIAFWSRLPGGGFAWGPFTDAYVPLKRGSDGNLVPSLGAAPVVHQPFGVLYNGLGVNFVVDSGTGLRTPPYTLSWSDVDGNFTTWTAGAGTVSSEPRGTVAFRPVLPPEFITGVIDDSRRLFTAV